MLQSKPLAIFNRNPLQFSPQITSTRWD